MSERGEGFFKAGGIFDVGGVEGAVDLAVEAAEDLAGADLDEVGGAGLLEEADALHPADGAGDLADEGVADGGAAGEQEGVDVGGDGEGGVVEGDRLQRAGELLLGGVHEGAVEGRADRKHDGALGAGLFAELGGALDGVLGAGDDGLVGRVEVGR